MDGSSPPRSTKTNKVVITILVSEAAKKLNMSTQSLRLALQQGLFDFGVAIKTSERRYTYVIFETRLEKFLKGGDYEEIYQRKAVFVHANDFGDSVVDEHNGNIC